MATSQDFVNWIPSAALDAKFLMFLLIAEKESLIRFGKGSTHTTIYFSEVREFHICLPPKNEQRRIVKRIEALQARTRRARESLVDIPVLVERLRGDILSAAFRGELTTQWREENTSPQTASALLQAILSDRRERWEVAERARLKEVGKETADEGWKGRYKEPAAFGDKNLPPIPDSWAWTSLDSIANLKGGLTKGKRRRRGERLRSVPYLRVANVQRGFLDLREVLEIEATDSEIEDLRLEQGDILFIEGGDRDKLGRGWIWEGQLPECIHQNHVFRARLLSEVVPPELVSYYANSIGQAYFFDQGKQTTNLASISLSKLAALPVPLIPAGEAECIALRIEQALSVLRKLENQVELSLKQLAALDRSILERAFSGDLVPQDLNDEPARSLVRRVRKSLSKEMKEPRPARRERSEASQKEKDMPDYSAIPATHLRDTVQAHGGSMDPSALWKQSALGEDIDAFYAQLRWEIESGLLREIELTDRQRVIEIAP